MRTGPGTAHRPGGGFPLAGRPRLDTLHDKVGGFLGNRKANADLLLRNIGERMAKDLELGDIVAVDKFVYSRPAADEIISELSERCDFVVTAIAD